MPLLTLPPAVVFRSLYHREWRLELWHLTVGDLLHGNDPLHQHDQSTDTWRGGERWRLVIWHLAITCQSVCVHVTSRRIPAVIVIDFDTDTFSESHVYQKAHVLPSDHLSPCYASLWCASGYRMPAPHGCPIEISRIMNSCWQYDPRNRPSFKKLRIDLSAIYSKII